MTQHATQVVTMPTGHTLRVLEHRARAHDFATWEAEALRAICAVIKPGSVVLDVGAEEGEFSALYGLIAGPENVHLFEPTPSVWPNIRAVWEANHTAPPGGAFAGFVGRTCDARHLRASLDVWPACSAGPLQHDSRFSVTTERPDIPATSLDLWRVGLRTRCAAKRIDVVACDVEGAEVLVIDGAQTVLNDDRPDVFVSVHPADFIERFPAPSRWGGPCRREHLFTLFAENGYDTRHVSTDHEEHWHFVPRGRR